MRTDRGRIRLVSDTNPFAFQCVGDGSADCCPFPPTAHVLVKGVMAAPYDSFNFTMTDPRLCAAEQ
ncbi:MAG: hypothetical protein U0263_32055 [Polyangiaceae bacterium]